MKTLKKYLLLHSMSAALFPLMSFSQHSIPSSSLGWKENETRRDAYVPNAGNNKNTFPGYKYKRVAGNDLGNSNETGIMSSSIFTTQVNVNASGLNIIGDAANEPNLTMDPSSPGNLAIGWRQFDNVTSDFRQAGIGYSSDGGQTWTFPGVIEPGIFHSDPVLDFNATGIFYYNSLHLDSLGIYSCKVFESADNGVSWNNGTAARGGDKQWMAVDRTAGVGNGNIYSSWSPNISSCGWSFTRSTDGNNSYESCTYVDEEPFWVGMAVGISGELYISGGGWDPNNMVVAKSVNAQVAGSVVMWTTAFVYMDGNLVHAPSVNPGGFMGSIDIEVDHSAGASQGNVYVLGTLSRISIADPGDVMFSRSLDEGVTWSPPVRINDDSSMLNTQWFGTLSVAPNGRIDAVWLDTRDAPSGSDSSALYYSFSVDEGNTWSVNEKMSDLFDPHVGYPNQFKIGDYFDMTSYNQGVHLAWANTFNGEQDVYYSYIIPPLGTGEKAIDTKAPVTIFPNPSDGSFTISRIARQARVEICNVTGALVYARVLVHAKEEIDMKS